MQTWTEARARKKHSVTKWKSTEEAEEEAAEEEEEAEAAAVAGGPRES